VNQSFGQNTFSFGVFGPIVLLLGVNGFELTQSQL
jgi:hypothetical protein